MGVKLVFAKSDLAKYPFIPEAADYIKPLDLRIENLANPELKPILERAEKRIEEALVKNPPEVTYRERDEDIEIPSFPVAVVIASAANSDFIKRRYALAEARRAYNLLKDEDEMKILSIANSFEWKIKRVKEVIGSRGYDFALHFIDFLENAPHEKEWKIVNKVVEDGWVYLTRQEVARLLQEEIRKHVEKKLQVNTRPMLPENVIEKVDKLVQKYAPQIGRAQFENLPKTPVNSAFPPCMRQTYEAAAAGRHLSHIGRFALTSFLLRIGILPEKVVDLFRSSADFNERMTRYQVEHISGARGSHTSYIPPSCDTLRTHGVCPGPDELCGKIRHPLAYYRRKLRILKPQFQSIKHEC